MTERPERLARAVRIHGPGWMLSRTVGGVLMALVVLAGMGFGFQQLARERDHHVNPPPGRMIRVDGHRLHLHCLGRGTPTVVLEAAPGEWSLHWAPVFDLISGFTHVCAYDRAGYGWSDPGPLPRTPTNLAQELNTLLDTSGEPGPFVIVAHRAASVMAWRFVDRYPEKAAGLVLLDAVPDEIAALYQQMNEGRRRRMEQTSTAAHFGLIRIMGAPSGLHPAPETGVYTRQASSPDFFEAYLDETARLFTTPQPENFAPDLPLFVVYQEFPVEPGSAAPKGLSAERYAQVWKQAQESVAARAEKGVTVPVPEIASHLPLDRPDIVVAVVQGAVAEVRNRK